MPNTLILCGGTGAHAGVAFLRLHTLGYALGFFRPEGAQDNRPFDFPKLYLVDQDAGPGEEREPTAWQLVTQLRERHPGRFDWRSSIGREEGPVLRNVTPLPIGSDKQWFRPPNNVLARRFEASAWLPVVASLRQRQIDYSKGMMGSPAVGSLLFKLKSYDERDRGLNHDETFGELLAEQGRIVVAGSGVGGTGAAVGPTLAQMLAQRGGSQVMAVMVLNWFLLDEEKGEEERRKRAQRRNRAMRENANSALEFYGQSLAQGVAAVPVGMPERGWIKRDFTADVAQPRREAFIHAVAALCGVRHFLRANPYDAGLYAVGAIDRLRLDGATAIPGGTLQGLAHQGETLAELLETWQRVLARPQSGRMRPAIYEAVARCAAPPQVAAHLGDEIAHYREQLAWLRDVLGVQGAPARAFTQEIEMRERLAGERTRLPIDGETPPERVPAALLAWTAGWIQDQAQKRGTALGLAIQPGAATAPQWPDYSNEKGGIGIPVREGGELTRVVDQNIAAVLDGFVDRQRLAANGWPHPLAAADYFRHALNRRDSIAVRQLELLLLGMMARRFELRPLARAGEAREREVSLEYLASEFRRQGCEGLADYGLFDRERDGELAGFTSPHTLLCPVPFMDDDDANRVWQGLWEQLSGAGDGTRWAQAPSPGSWGETSDLLIRQIRVWLGAEKARLRGVAPAWTRLFEGGPPSKSVPSCGYGERVRVYWGSSSAATGPVVEIDLPAPEPDGRGGEVPQKVLDAEDIGEAAMLAAVPELASVRDGAGQVLFTAFAFAKPDTAGEVRGYWEDHLQLLRERGTIRAWSRTEKGELRVVVLDGGARKQAVLPGSEVLSRDRIEIARCVPFVQTPVPGSPTPAGDLRCPDLPLRAEYLDLALTPQGKSIADLLRAKERLDPFLKRPEQRRDTQQRLVLRWTLSLRGRRDPMSFEIRLEGKDGQPFAAQHTAHLMVWPRFRDHEARWRAYYVYGFCSLLGAVCDVLHMGIGGGAGAVAQGLRRRRDEGGRPLLGPLSFQAAQAGAEPAHDGDVPVAFALRQLDPAQELGLYLVPLEPIANIEVPAAVDAAVDFGTSHTAAAFRVGSAGAQTLELAAELDPAARAQGLSLHVCESAAHVLADEAQGGLLVTAAWMPTYRTSRGNSTLPSELLLAASLAEMKSRSIADWAPLRDFTIAPLDVSRSDLADCLLSDFKWEAGSEFFRGQENPLRRHYLTLYLELAVADIAYNTLHGLPKTPVQLTFTYPLRAGDRHRDDLIDSIQQAVRRSALSLGVPLGLQGGVGLYDESRAARVATREFGQVCLVGDLGGGTLDLFIAADNGQSAPLREVADSVRLGGNLLLHQIAAHPAGYLPPEGPWYGAATTPRETETYLRAWMRSMGCSRLWGADAGGRPELKSLALTGFSQAAQAERARRLIDRYFRLIVEYMARNLVAFLVREWYPKVAPADHPRLKIAVQLRGNGWRLRYQPGNYLQTTREVQALVRSRLAALWPLAADNPYPAPDGDEHWELTGEDVDPKLAPIRNVVGKAMEPKTAAGLWYTHTLTGLEVHRNNGAFLPVAWTEAVPFFTGGSRQLQIKALSPAMPLSDPQADEQVVIEALEPGLKGQINAAFQDEVGAIENETLLRAPVAPLVWEKVFESRAFWPADKKGARP